MVDRIDPKAKEIRRLIARCLLVGLLSSMLLSSLIAVCWAQEPRQAQPVSNPLIELSLKDLMNIMVTSASKKEQRASEVAAGIFVITHKDIRRSGVTSIPEALRMVPGLQVARIDANKWAVTSRGFNGRFAVKLLVMIDGRSIYTPLFSGVFWDVQDLPLEDVERIEVIRGPGATMWGANAVNGIINIITKKAGDTQGVLVSGIIGTEERGTGVLRYGAKLGDHVPYRVYLKYLNRGGSVTPAGNEVADEWDLLRGGFRMDWEIPTRGSLTLQGDIYDGEIGETLTKTSLTAPIFQTFNEIKNVAGGNILGRWRRNFSDSSNVTLQLYYDRTERETSLFEETRDIFDIDFQHLSPLGKHQEVVWGIGYRFTHDNLVNTFSASLNPDDHEDYLFSAFAQDEIVSFQKTLRLTIGSKFEYNSHTQFEIQPNIRLLWSPKDRHTVWTAVSKAVRVPSRAEEDSRLNEVISSGPPPTVVTLLGNRNTESEDLLAYELGYRVRPNDRVFLDIATFFNDYDDLVTIEPGVPFVEALPAPSHLVIPSTLDNKMNGKTYGVEVTFDWLMLDWWRQQVAYTFLQINLRLDEDSGDTQTEDTEGKSPHHQLSLRSSMNLPGDLELDFWLRYIDELPALNIESYVTLDARLGWMPKETLELSVVGQNLLDNQHPEFPPEFIRTAPSEVERSVYGKITWHF